MILSFFHRKNADAREEKYSALLTEYGSIMSKVCYVYAGADASYEDLWQEVCINLWQGLDSFRGDAKLSTWIYRLALNTCITWHRKNSRHSNTLSIDEPVLSIAGDDFQKASEEKERYELLRKLISELKPLEKALVTLWLEDRSYDEIALITGLSKSNVATSLHRIKERLKKKAMVLK
ncbi:MAG: RNA polymerase sigma factor [Muribaculaceae bacterium]|nr:RNA polymerase sigma factor [Muribaculaceae bacterium]